MWGKYDNIAIRAIASTVPESVIDNEIYADVLGEKKVKKHIKMTGVRRRHKLVEGQKASDLAVNSAERVLEHTGWHKDDIRALIYVTQTPDLVKPATAFVLQKRLGIGKDCVVFDVNLGCSAFVTGMQIIAGLLHDNGDKGLLLIADGSFHEQRSSLVDDMLFGDAGCAIAIEAIEGHPMLYQQESDGNRYEVISKEHGGTGYMNGNAVFAFTINDVTHSIKNARQNFQITEDDIDYYVLHQGQKMIVSNLAEICDIPESKVLYSMEEYGNTEGVSIPLTLCYHREILQKKGLLRLFMSGFGVGLSWGSIYMEIDSKDIMSVHTLAKEEN